MILTKGQNPRNCQINVKATFSAEIQAKEKPPKHSKNGLFKRFLAWS